MNVLMLFLTKVLLEGRGVPSQRATEVGVATSLLPGMTGLMFGLVIAQREGAENASALTPPPLPPQTPPTPPTRPYSGQEPTQQTTTPPTQQTGSGRSAR